MATRREGPTELRKAQFVLQVEVVMWSAQLLQSLAMVAKMNHTVVFCRLWRPGYVCVVVIFVNVLLRARSTNSISVVCIRTEIDRLFRARTAIHDLLAQA